MKFYIREEGETTEDAVEAHVNGSYSGMSTAFKEGPKNVSPGRKFDIIDDTGYVHASGRAPFAEKKDEYGDFRSEVVRCCPNINNDSIKDKLSLAAMGIAGEAGEVVDALKKHLFHNDPKSPKPLDLNKLVKELGDLRWYIEYLLLAVDVSIEEVELANIAKLRARFPTGFNFEDANARKDQK